MTRKRFSSNEKKLKALLSENGGLAILQNDLLNAIKKHPSKDDVFASLEEILISVSKFQDSNHNKMDELKRLLKENETVMLHLGPLHNSIKKCGRGIWKSEKHKTFVQNKAGILKKNLLSRKVTYDEVNETKIFLVTDYYNTAQRLAFLKQQKDKQSSPLNEAMVRELKVLVENFIEEHFNKISSNIEELRRIVK